MKAIRIILSVLAVIAAVLGGIAWGVERASAACSSPSQLFSGNPGNPYYGIQEQDRIECEFGQLEERIRTLENINANLLKKVEGIQGGPAAAQPERVIETKETIIRESDNSRVEALEKRVGNIERAVSFLQGKVMEVVNRAVALMSELVKKR